MAEIVSRQAARVAASATGVGKMLPTDMGKIMAVVIDSPDTAAWAQNDTIASPVAIPVGAIPLGAFVKHGAFGTSVTLDVGLRNYKTAAALDADGIVAARAIASAGNGYDASGALCLNPAAQTVVSQMYATLGGADPTDNADITIVGLFLVPG
jgi:hypothetical protein